MFECKRCGKRWNEERYGTGGTFYTLCEECSACVLYEWSMGITKVDLQEVKMQK